MKPHSVDEWWERLRLEYHAQGRPVPKADLDWYRRALQRRRLQARTVKILYAAEKSEDYATAVVAIHAARKNLELIGKLSGELTPNAASETTTLQVAIVYQDSNKPAPISATPILEALPEPSEHT
jgi:hypothetical protein